MALARGVGTTIGVAAAAVSALVLTEADLRRRVEGELGRLLAVDPAVSVVPVAQAVRPVGVAEAVG